MVGKLIDAAKAEGADYAVDVYPHYGSDVEATLGSGCDIRHGLIGAGVYASHGYERSHLDGVYNTLKVLKGYLKIINLYYVEYSARFCYNSSIKLQMQRR